MIVTLYKISDAPNKIRKTLGTAVLSLEGTLKENCSIMDPVIMVYNSGFINANYAYIQAFGRYYHINDIVSVKNDLWEIRLHVDVLFTYAAGILAAPCIVAKSSSNFNLYLNDANYKCYQNPHIFSYEFPSGFTPENARFIVTMFGKYQASS